MSRIRNWRDFLALVRRHRFPFALASIVGITILMTAISLSLYVSSGTSELDLSRPGFEKIREEVKQAPNDNFSSTGPVDRQSIDEFDALYKKQRNYINALGDFQDSSLDDSSLQLEAN